MVLSSLCCDQNEGKPINFIMTTLCYLNITSNSNPFGTITISLRNDIVPRTCSNFMQLCSRSPPLGYQDSVVHRLIKGFMVQMGDYERGNGTGGKSVYGDR